MQRHPPVGTTSAASAPRAIQPLLGTARLAPRRLAAEFCLILLVCTTLWWLAQALQLAAPRFISQRYAALPPSLVSLTPWQPIALAPGMEIWQPLPAAQRAGLWLQQAGPALTMLGLLGWLALASARARRAWSAGAVLTLLAAAALWSLPFGLAPGLWLVALGAGALLALGGLLPRYARPGGCLAQAAPTSGWAACIWPLWLALAGAGVLWITGFAATGPLVPHGDAAQLSGSRYMGLQQADGLFAASSLLCAATLWGLPALRTLLQSGRILAAALRHRVKGPLVAGLLLVLALGLAWLGHPGRAIAPWLPLRGLGMPHLSGEILRCLFLLPLAWGVYRYGEWASSIRRMVSGVLLLTASMVLALLALGLSQDRGPIQVLALQGVVMLAAAVIYLLVRLLAKITHTFTVPPSAPRSRAVALLVALAALSAALLLVQAQTRWAPGLSVTAAERALARERPFEASSANHAQVWWLMDAAVSGHGFGLAQVPFCGARAWLGIGRCSLTSGAPIQLPSDFAVAGLVAAWGVTTAGALCILLLFWCYAVTQTAQTSACAYQPAQPLLRWRAWLITLSSLSLAAQTLVSVGGTLGWSLFAGVTLPLLGYGMVSLMAAGLWAGLAQART